MIEKKRPRKLDSSKDSRVRGADEMYDALNVTTTSDYGEGQGGNNDGVLKAAYGNSLEAQLTGIPAGEQANARVIGSVMDDENDVLYFFVFHTNAKYQGVYAYDPRDFFGTNESPSTLRSQISPIHRSKLYNFRSDDFVKADVVVLSSSENEQGVDPVLYFTDGHNEPRSIHPIDARQKLQTPGLTQNEDGGLLGAQPDPTGYESFDHFDVQDMLHVCPKTPVHPPTAFFENDPSTRASNFEGVSGFQFAYQYIYDTKEESALSTYSDIMVPPAYFQQGAKASADLSSSNICRIVIPTKSDDFVADADVSVTHPNEIFNRYTPKSVKKIRILAREGNNGTFSVVDTINNPYYGVIASDNISYEFRNDRVKKGFSKTEAQKPFDAVPLVAGTQTTASNRMMYGDYLSGYDNVDVTATATVSYESRPEDFKSLDVKVKSTIDLLSQGNYINNRRAGFYFDVDGFPDSLEANSSVDITLTVRPKRNWHIYNSHNSFHGSRHLGNLSTTVVEADDSTGGVEIGEYDVHPTLAQDGNPQVGGISGSSPATNSRGIVDNIGLNTIFGANKGVSLGPFSPSWKTVDSQAGVDVDEVTGNISSFSLGGANSVPARYGTSAANPFILRGRPLLFNLAFKITRDLTGPSMKLRLRDYISRAITWDRENVSQSEQFSGIYYDDAGNSEYFELINLTSTYEYNIDEGLNGGDASTTPDEALDGVHKINVATSGDDRKHLIVAVGNGNLVNENASPQQLANVSPCGYFIVNKARPKFSLRSRNNISPDATYGVFHLNLDALTDVETLTCIPFVDSDIWKDKGLRLNPNDDKERGPEDTKFWAVNPLGNFLQSAGNFFSNLFGNDEEDDGEQDSENEENWGLRGVSTWALESMIIDSWYCYSKEFMARNELPEMLFKSSPSDYAEYTNGPTLLTDEDVAEGGEFFGAEVSDDTVEGGLRPVQAGDVYGSPGVNVGGDLKNAAVLSQQKVNNLINNNATGVGGNSEDQYGRLHFRHNRRASVGGDGYLPAINGYRFTTSNQGFNNNNSNRFTQTRGRIVGYLDTGDSWFRDISGNVYNSGGAEDPTNSGLASFEKGFTILDGAGGIGSAPGGREAKVHYDQGKTLTMGSVNGAMLFTGYIGPRGMVLPTKIKKGIKPPFDLDNQSSIGSARYENYFDKYGQESMLPFLGQFNYMTLSPNGGFMWAETTNSDDPWPGQSVSAVYYGQPLADDSGAIIPIADGGQTLLPEDQLQENHDFRVDVRQEFEDSAPTPELLDVGGGTVLAEEVRSGGRSFKTRADHSFGIVFYDERGRAGRVNPIKDASGKSSVYVGGYDDAARSGNYGRAKISFEFPNNLPIPEWAHHYQIVYAGNSSKSDFVQYTTGGAFVGSSNEGSAEQDSQNIYVSLNYLQGNKDVSYTESFGAVSSLGDKKLYKFSAGDKLRIISYFNSNPFDEDGDLDEATRVFPSDYEFEVVGVETFSPNPETNPLARAFDDGGDTNQVQDAKSGEFLVLKNNVFATGFTYNDVKNGENNPTTNAHFWNNICVVEIYSPTKETSDEDAKLYYETGRVYDIGKSNGTVFDANGVTIGEGLRYMKVNPVVIERGDVWFRRTPLATPEFNTDSDSGNFGKFENLITYDRDNEKGSTPRFQNYYLETQAFNDTFSGNNSISRGKPNLVDDEFGQRRNKSSVTYSDKHIFDKSKNRFSSFNGVQNPFKVLPGEYGNIDSLINNYDSIIVLQKDKVSRLPVERSVLSSADGSNMLVQNKEVLGSQIFYPGDYGSDNHPEAVLRAGGYVFFASKTEGEVYRLNPGGAVEVISGAGMKSEFYTAFSALGDNAYITTGYDPLEDEFLISLTTATPGQTGSGYVVLAQPSIGDVGADEGQDVFDTANTDVITGCTNPYAENFCPNAIESDGTCVILGCTDRSAINWNPQATDECANDGSGTTSVDLTDCGNAAGRNKKSTPTPVDDPRDCVCRFFNPCIIDSFSLVPDGKVTYSDVVEFNEIISFGNAQVPAQYGPAYQLLTASGVINGLGLDFVWVPADELPPIYANGGQEWDFVEDQWTSSAFNFLCWAYTEGPKDPSEAIAGWEWAYNNGWVEFTYPSAYGSNPNGNLAVTLHYPDQNLADTNFDHYWVPNNPANSSEAFPGNEGIPMWSTYTVPDAAAGYRGQRIIGPLADYSATSNTCIHFGCKTDGAINYDFTATNDCSTLEAIAERTGDGPTDGIDFDDIICQDNRPFPVTVCLIPDCDEYGETNVASTPGAPFADMADFLSTGSDDYGQYLSQSLGGTWTIAGDGPVDEIWGAMLGRMATKQFPCENTNSTWNYAPFVVGDGCGTCVEETVEEGGDFLEGLELYGYFEDCCCFACEGVYYENAEGSAVDYLNWTGDFHPYSGKPDCVSRRYLISDGNGGSDFTLLGDGITIDTTSLINPDFDYNPYVLGQQTPEDPE